MSNDDEAIVIQTGPGDGVQTSYRLLNGVGQDLRYGDKVEGTVARLDVGHGVVEEVLILHTEGDLP